MPAVPLCSSGELVVPRSQTPRGWGSARPSRRGWGGGGDYGDGRGDTTPLSQASVHNPSLRACHAAAGTRVLLLQPAADVRGLAAFLWCRRLRKGRGHVCFLLRVFFFDALAELWAATVSIWFLFPAPTRSRCALSPTAPLLPPGCAGRCCGGTVTSLGAVNFANESEDACEGLRGGNEEEEGGRAGHPLSEAPLHHLPRALGSFSQSQIRCSRRSSRRP